MNKSIRGVAVVTILMFLALLVNATAGYWIRTDELTNDPRNTRVQDEQFGAQLALAVPRGVSAGTLYLAVQRDYTLKLLEGRLRAVGARNSVTALDETGAIRGSYAKAHLVPGGEYLPLREWLTPLGLARLVPGDIDFWPGPGPRTVDLGPWGRVGVQVCYEIIFSGQVTDRADRPQFIFNPSNDGWFGAWGPPQHLAQARLRAIEDGLPVVRATPTGIRAMIDADGRVLKSLPMHQAGRIDTPLPPPHAPTLFARFGNILPVGFALLLLALAIAFRRRGR